MSELTSRVGTRLVQLYGKGDPAELDNRIQKIAEDAVREDLNTSQIEESIQDWEAQLPRNRPGWSSSAVALADLQRFVLGQETYRAKFGNKLQRFADWFFDHYVAVASLVTVLASGFYGLAYERFYQALDITPEQAGLSVGQILIHSAIGGLALVILASLAAFVILMPAVPVRDDLDSKSQRGNLTDLAVNVGVTVLGIFFLFNLALILHANPKILAAIAIGSTLVLLFTNIRLHRRWIVVPYPTLKPMVFRLHRYLVLGVAVAIPLGLATTALLTVGEANNLGNKASNGEAVRDPLLIGMPFLGVRAEPALVSWRGQKPMEGIPRCMFYLGASNGSVILYDHRSTGTFQVPGSDVSIELRRHMSSCEAPLDRRVPSVWRHGKDLVACGQGKWQSGMKPRFSFEWTMEGSGITDRFERMSPYLDDSSLAAGSVVHCRVTATTPLGSDVAVSRGIVVRHQVPTRLAASSR